jgi:hypothetical protein
MENQQLQSVADRKAGKLTKGIRGRPAGKDAGSLIFWRGKNPRQKGTPLI